MTPIATSHANAKTEPLRTFPSGLLEKQDPFRTQLMTLVDYVDQWHKQCEEKLAKDEEMELVSLLKEQRTLKAKLEQVMPEQDRNYGTICCLREQWLSMEHRWDEHDRQIPRKEYLHQYQSLRNILDNFLDGPSDTWKEFQLPSELTYVVKPYQDATLDRRAPKRRRVNTHSSIPARKRSRLEAPMHNNQDIERTNVTTVTRERTSYQISYQIDLSPRAEQKRPQSGTKRRPVCDKRTKIAASSIAASSTSEPKMYFLPQRQYEQLEERFHTLFQRILGESYAEFRGLSNKIRTQRQYRRLEFCPCKGCNAKLVINSTLSQIECLQCGYSTYNYMTFPQLPHNGSATNRQLLRRNRRGCYDPRKVWAAFLNQFLDEIEATPPYKMQRIWEWLKKRRQRSHSRICTTQVREAAKALRYADCEKRAARIARELSNERIALFSKHEGAAIKKIVEQLQGVLLQMRGTHTMRNFSQSRHIMLYSMHVVKWGAKFIPCFQTKDLRLLESHCASLASVTFHQSISFFTEHPDILRRLYQRLFAQIHEQTSP